MAFVLVVGTVSLDVQGFQASAHHDGIPYSGEPVCPHGGNYASTACLLGVTHFGLYALWNSNWMRVDPSLIAIGAHINHGIWSYSGAPCDRFVEIGITRGWKGNDLYGWYIAVDNKYGYDDAFLATTTWDGQTHTYHLQYDGAPSDEGRYSYWLDGSRVTYIDGLGYGSCIGQGGLEISRVTAPPDNRFRSDTYDFTPMGWYDTNRQHRSGWNTSHFIVQYPCGSYPEPSCMNGLYYGPSHWADNKP